MVRWLLSFMLILQLFVGLARAGGALWSQNEGQGPLVNFQAAGQPLLRTGLQGALGDKSRGSLFADDASGGFFAPMPTRLTAPKLDGNLKGLAGLKALIASAEAGKAQYDAVVWSARIKPPKRPTEMTLAEIDAWTRATPGQNHAIGRYQFIPKTLRALVRRAGLTQSTRFTPEVQDQLAMLLFEDAGLSRFLAGQLPRASFMNNLAKIWAGLPTSSGKSYYYGYAGNKATISRARFDAAMAQFFPQHS